MAGGGVGLKSDTGYAEARRLGHHWVGEEHALLALSRGEGAAGDALRAAGATPERLEAAIVRMLERAEPPVERRETDSPDLTPAMYSAFGRAEGLALARGEEPTPDDLLVALLWRAGLGSSLLHLLGVDRAALARGFAEAGIAVPPGEPKPLDLRPTKRVDVPYEQLMEIVAAMPSRLPDGSPFGFNLHHETRRAWIVVGQDLDAKRLVSDFKSDTSGRAGVSGEEEVSD